MSDTDSKKKKVYFVASLAAKGQYGWAYKEIAKAFRDKGFEVWDDVNNIDEAQAKSLSKQEITKYYTKIQSRIKKADIFVAEASKPSLAVGYEIGVAVMYGKPTLILRSEELQNEPGAPLRGNNSKLVILLKYGKDNIKNQVNIFLKRVSKGIFTKRLAMQFTEGQVQYVEFRRKEGGSPVKTFNGIVREIIDETAVADPNYENTQQD